MLQSEIWLDPVRANRKDIDQFVTVVALPLYHVFALTVCGLLTIRTGGLGVLIPNPRDIPGMIKALEGYPITTIPAVNTLYNAMLNSPDFHKLDFSKLIAANGGGMAVQEAVAKRWFEHTHTPIIEGYGLSETSPWSPAIRSPARTIGARSACRCRRRNFDSRRRRQRGAARPAWRNLYPRAAGHGGLLEPPGRNRQGHDAGWLFKTGDVGLMNDNGFFKIVDRKKDMILVSGFNVYPNEIEDVVAKLPGVFEVAAVGIPDSIQARR